MQITHSFLLQIFLTKTQNSLNPITKDYYASTTSSRQSISRRNRDCSKAID